MTSEAAKAAGATLVSKDRLFEQADILTIHSTRIPSRTLGSGSTPRPAEIAERPTVQRIRGR